MRIECQDATTERLEFFRQDRELVFRWPGCPFEYDARFHVIHRDGQVIELTPKESVLMDLYVLFPHRILPLDKVCQVVWEDNEIVSDRNSFNDLVRSLRGKVELDPSHPRHIRTRRGFGTFFEPSEQSPVNS